ncbi:MAG: HAD-IB family phosphatase [Gammaproteobacteria bacterium]|nr:HAD-IB family phosphatase [Gammaproteobacteria bacterium]
MSGAEAGLVIFDCDSTLSAIEGVDELAASRGLGAEIRELTAAAMAGRTALEEVYGRRLDLIRPHRADLDWLGKRYVEALVPGAADTVRILHSLGRQVHIVSAGFLQAVHAVATALGVARENVHAVELRFNANGSYAGFAESPLTRSGGKAAICSELMTRYGQAVAIGDGATDLEMKNTGARVIGFGGVIVRPEVRKAADVYVTEPSLLAVLPHILTPLELRGIPVRPAG